MTKEYFEDEDHRKKIIENGKAIALLAIKLAKKR